MQACVALEKNKNFYMAMKHALSQAIKFEAYARHTPQVDENRVVTELAL